MTENELARALFGRREREARESGGTTITVTATATADSADGMVPVDFGTDIIGDDKVTDPDTGEVVYAPPSQSVEVPVAGGVSAGDTVSVLIVDGTPVQAIGTGSVDRVGAVAESASTAAQEAKAVAEATGQHFWHDTRGAHVTEAEREDYETEATGFQQLMTSVGTLLTRAVNGIEYLLRSDTRSGMAIYDGTCTADDANLAQHLVASFSTSGAQIGKSSSGHIILDDDELSIYGTVYDPWGEEPASIGRTGHISQEDIELGNVNGTTFIVSSEAESDVVGSCYRNGSFAGQDFYLNVQKVISQDVVVPSNRYFFFTSCRYTYHSLESVMYNGVELQAGIDYTLYPTSGIYVRDGIAVGATITVVYKTTDRVTRFGLDQTGAKGDDNAFGIFPPTAGAANVTPNFGVDWNGHITHIEGSTTKADNLSYVSSTDSIRSPVYGYATRNTSTTNGGSVQYARCGQLVVVFFSLLVTATANDAILATGLPKPPVNSFVPAVAATNRGAGMYVDPDGRLRLTGNTSGSAWWIAAAPYFTRD